MTERERLVAEARKRVDSNSWDIPTRTHLRAVLDTLDETAAELAERDAADEGYATAAVLADGWRPERMSAERLAEELADARELLTWMARYYAGSEKVREHGRERVRLHYWLDLSHIEPAHCTADTLQLACQYAERCQQAARGMVHVSARRAS